MTLRHSLDTMRHRRTTSTALNVKHSHAQPIVFSGWSPYGLTRRSFGYTKFGAKRNGKPVRSKAKLTEAFQLCTMSVRCAHRPCKWSLLLLSGELHLFGRSESGPNHCVVCRVAPLFRFCHTGFVCVCVLNLFGCPWYVMCLPVHKTVTLCPPVSGWEELNHSCKIIITAGLRFTLAKGVLSTFFLMCLGCGVHFCHLVAAVAKCRCPPVTKTYLMSDPDQPLDSAVLFEP